MLGRDTQTSIRGLVESSQFFALGMLTYELLNGAPPTQGRGEDGRGIKFAALPSLNEDANDVLRRMLTPNPGFTSGTGFSRRSARPAECPARRLQRHATRDGFHAGSHRRRRNDGIPLACGDASVARGRGQ